MANRGPNDKTEVREEEEKDRKSAEKALLEVLFEEPDNDFEEPKQEPKAEQAENRELE